MAIETLFTTQDLIIILGIVISSSQLKNIMKKIKNINSHIYVFIPFFVCLPIVAFQIIFKSYEIKDILVYVIKYWAGSVFFYDVVMERFKNIKIMGGENAKNNNDNNIGNC